MYKITKRYVTLIEMMIVMFLIAMIIGVVAYNYSGSLDEGKAFKTKANMEKIETILSLEISENPAIQENIGDNWKTAIANSSLVKSAKDLQKDGWGNDFEVSLGDDGEITITSQKYNEYLQKHPNSKFRK